MQATTSTSVQDGEGAQEKAWRRQGAERGREDVSAREQTDTPGIACARELELYVPE